MRTRRTYFWRFLDQNEDEDPAFYNQPRRLQSTLREVHVEIQCSAVTVNSPQSKTSSSSTTDFIIGRAKRQAFVYVPVLKTLKNLLSKPEVLEKTFSIQESTQGLYTVF
ncbi:hypothetical protein MHYP_G00195150 [Metynnis hypsauchen]